MNYNSFFGLSDSPFLDDLDLRFLFLSQQFREFLEKLTGFVSERRGIAVVSGEEGVGKTMLVQALLHRLPASVHSLVITRPAAEPLAISLMLAQKLDITLKHRNLVNLTPLAQAIQNAAQQDKFFFLVVDEAHVLTDQHLEEIYVLSQIEHQGSQLLPIFLAGGKGLVQKLASQTNQRLQGLIRYNLALARLSFEETIQYIDHRLRQVGSSYKECFAESCSGQLFSRTGGIPLRINQTCDQALNRAWQENQSRVTRDLLGGEEPVPASQYKPLAPPRRYSFPTRIVAWSTAVLLAGLAGYAAYSNFYHGSLGILSSEADNPASPPRPSPVSRPEQVAPQPEPTALQPEQAARPPEQAVPPPEGAAPQPGQAASQPGQAAPPAPETLTPAPGPGQAEEQMAALPEPVSPEPQLTPEYEQVLPQAESPADSPQQPQASEMETAATETTEAEASPPQATRPETHRVAPEDGGLLRIVAGYYPDGQDIGYNAVILANSEINNEDIIYPGQKLSLPAVNKNNNIITLNNNQHFSIYKQYYSSAQVEQATTQLAEQEIRYVVRQTRLPGVGPIYRIFLGGYDSKAELQKALIKVARN